MREDDSNWFSKWEEELPPQDELMPLSQSLITPDLALAFNIPNPHHQSSLFHHTPPPSQPNSSAEELSAAAEFDEPARTLKRPRLVWTPQLHKRFVDAVAHLGIKNAVPKTIMQLMSVDGLTRENVASHLQKYRLYLKRMQGISSGGGGAAADAATDHLFASSPVPAHFLRPFVPVAAMHHHHHQMTTVVGQQQFQHLTNGHPLVRQAAIQRIGTAVQSGSSPDDLELANGRKILTLFPTGDD